MPDSERSLGHRHGPVLLAASAGGRGFITYRDLRPSGRLDDPPSARVFSN